MVWQVVGVVLLFAFTGAIVALFATRWRRLLDR